MENTAEEKIVKKPPFRKTILLIVLAIIIYLLLIIWAKKLQMISTFPWVGVNVQDLVWYVDSSLEFEEINFIDSDWYNINWLYVWTWKGKTVYYFHWNWWPLNYFYSEIKYINELWYNVISYDYPWYWKSEWYPYKNNVDRFSKEFYEYIKKEKGISDEDLIVWWYSIWTAVATDFASKNTFDKLILVSPLSSRYDMSNYIFWFPLQKYLFVSDSYKTKKLVQNFNNSVLIIHWNNDKIVPFWQWKKVFDNYSWEKNFIEIDNFWHNYIIDTYWESLKNIFKKHLKWEKLWFIDNYFFIWAKEKHDLEFENRIDLFDDYSIQKFVSAKVPFWNKSYKPFELDKIGSDFIYDTKWWSQILRKEANDALQKMWESFYNAFDKKLSVVSAYRSYSYQKWIKDRWCPDNLCAKAWYSEHQSWLAIDIFEASTNKIWMWNSNLKSYYDWMNENAHTYWFHNTYQKWLDIDTYEIEPWHWRFIWIELATYLKNNNITIAEYYNKKN